MAAPADVGAGAGAGVPTDDLPTAAALGLPSTLPRGVKKVAVFCGKFDPISVPELRACGEALRFGGVDMVLLVPLGCEYASVDSDPLLGPLIPLVRFLLCHAGVESTFSPQSGVHSIGLQAHALPTAAVLHGVQRWADAVGVDCLQLLQLCGVDCTPSGSVPQLLLSPFRADCDAATLDTLEVEDAVVVKPAGAPVCPGLTSMAAVDVRRRLLSSAPVRGLFPPTVLGIMRRYGLYNRRVAAGLPLPVARCVWYARGWQAAATAGGGASSDTRSTADRGGVAGAIPLPASPVVADLESGAKTAIYGGSFAPVTTAHMEVACETLNSGGANEIWFVPCGPRPDKASLRTGVLQRLLHCLIAVEDVFDSADAVYVSPVDVPVEQSTPSYPLIRRLSCLFPTHTFALLIGADLLPTLPKWQFSTELLRDVHFIVTPRPGTEATDAERPAHCEAVALPPDATMLSSPLSSTEVRNRLVGRRLFPPFAGAGTGEGSHRADGDAATTGMGSNRTEAIEGLVPRLVGTHIQRYNLYSSGTLTPASSPRSSTRELVLKPSASAPPRPQGGKSATL